MATGDEDLSRTILAGSDCEYDSICQPCLTDGKNIEAHGYCVDCCEYLCKKCFDYHRLLSVTRKHVLLNKDEMADGQKKLVKKDKCTIDCPRHDDEVIKYHCRTHSFLGCTVCITTNHKQCLNECVEYIPDISKNINKTDIYKGFNDLLDGVKEDVKNIHTDVNDLVETVKNVHKDEVSSVEQFVENHIASVRELEKILKKEADESEEATVGMLERVAERCFSLNANCQDIANETGQLEITQQYCNMYIKMVQERNKFTKLVSEVRSAFTDLRSATVLKFKPNTLLSEGLGGFVIKCVTPKPTYIKDIDIHMPSDKHTCYVTAMCILKDGSLIIVDHGNFKLKRLHGKTHKVTSELVISEAPYGATVLPNNQVAVTIPDYKSIIAIVNMEPKLSVVREILFETLDKCYDIAYCEGKVFVLFTSDYLPCDDEIFNTAEIWVMNEKGDVLRTLETRIKGSTVPDNLAINPVNNLLYVTNWGSKDVACLRHDGTVVARYSDYKLRTPRQITFDSRGTAYVCDRDSDTVFLVTQDFEKVRVILTCSDKLKQPSAICFNENEEKLFVGGIEQNTIKVFRYAHDGI